MARLLLVSDPALDPCDTNCFCNIRVNGSWKFILGAHDTSVVRGEQLSPVALSGDHCADPSRFYAWRQNLRAKSCYCGPYSACSLFVWFVLELFILVLSFNVNTVYLRPVLGKRLSKLLCCDFSSWKRGFRNLHRHDIEVRLHRPAPERMPGWEHSSAPVGKRVDASMGIARSTTICVTWVSAAASIAWRV